MAKPITFSHGVPPGRSRASTVATRLTTKLWRFETSAGAARASSALTAESARPMASFWSGSLRRERDEREDSVGTGGQEVGVRWNRGGVRGGLRQRRRDRRRLQIGIEDGELGNGDSRAMRDLPRRPLRPEEPREKRGSPWQAAGAGGSGVDDLGPGLVQQHAGRGLAAAGRGCPGDRVGQQDGQHGTDAHKEASRREHPQGDENLHGGSDQPLAARSESAATRHLCRTRARKARTA